MFFGYTKATYNGKSYETDSFANLEIVSEKSLDSRVYKDTYTGVLYRTFGHGITPIMEADGTCLTWDEWTKRTNNN